MSLVDGVDTKHLPVLELHLGHHTLHLAQRQQSSETGDTLWAAGSVLARYLYHVFRDAKPNQGTKYAIDLGSGAGATGLALALALGETNANLDIVLTDLDVIVNSGILQENIKRNVPLSYLLDDATIHVSCRSLNWKEKWDILPHSYDLVISSDCVYGMEMIEPFVSTLEWLSNPPTKIIVGVERRDSLVIDAWCDRAKKTFDLTRVTHSRLRKIAGDAQAQDVEVYILRRKDRRKR